MRHLAAYAELLACDLEQAKQDAAAGIVAAVIIGVAVFFAVLMGGIAVIAVTWDTPHRLAAIAWMGGGFLAIAVVAMIYRTKTLGAQAPFLASVRREWLKDSVLVERILADDEPT